SRAYAPEAQTLATHAAMTRSRGIGCGGLGVAAKHVVHIRGLLEQRVRTPRIPDPGGGPRMRVHRNAKTTPKGRALIVQRVEVDGWSVAQTAAAFGVSARTVHKWRARHAAAGLAGLDDRASAPQRIHHRTAPRLVAAIAALRAQQRSGAAIALRLG